MPAKLHDEILTLTFEAGTLFQQETQTHFGLLVSHVSRRWRNIALTTPFLWTIIQFTKADGDIYPETQIERAVAFLSRSNSLPVEFYVEGVNDDLDFDEEDLDAAPPFVQVMLDHIGRCCRLSIEDASPFGLTYTLKHFSSHAAPLLRSINLSQEINFDYEWNLDAPVFQLGTPNLQTAQISSIYVPGIPGLLETFLQLTSLQLHSIFLGNAEYDAEETYREIRSSFMALPFLSYLELQVDDSFTMIASRLPMVLPALQFLQLDADGHLDNIFRSFRAAALIAFKLNGGDSFSEVSNAQLELSFPALEHLVIGGHLPDDRLDGFARRCPSIKRLTAQSDCDIHRLLKRLCSSICRDGEDGVATSDEWARWPALEVIAVSCSEVPLDLNRLAKQITVL